MTEKITEHLTTHTSRTMADEIRRRAKESNKTVSAFIHACLVEKLNSGQCGQCRETVTLLRTLIEMPLEPEVSGRMFSEIDYEYPAVDGA